jgi:hypothetical protein
VDPSRILTQLQPGVANNPLCGDGKRLVVVFPDVDAGDSISLTWRRHVHHPPIPGAYSTISLFQRTLTFNDTRFSVTAPIEMKLVMDADDIPAKQETRTARPFIAGTTVLMGRMDKSRIACRAIVTSPVANFDTPVITPSMAAP